MRFQLLATGLVFFLGMATASRPIGERTPPLKPVPNKWRVWLKEDAKKSAREHAEWASSIHETRTEGHAGLHHVFDIVPGVQGYMGEFSDHVVDIIRKDKDVSISVSAFHPFPSYRGATMYFSQRALLNIIWTPVVVISGALTMTGLPIPFFAPSVR